MEFIGDLERAFASAIYPNRVAIAIGGAALLVALAILARRRRWDRLVRRHPRAATIVAVAALVVGLPLAWYLGSPLILSTTVDEPPPAAAGGPISSSAAPSPEVSIPQPSPSGIVVRSGSFTGADEFHFGRGTAHVIPTAAGGYVVRLEDFAVRNGPDLYVYLSPSAEGYADGAVELGPLKADTGNQNYDVPAGVDPAGANSVVIWCKQFGVLFATAPLPPS
ncbi:MAG TPA: DM13 domain-containing protein [Candidatus Limnocylindrales bacterium]|nr:DM13 domain-containing protein [Candidatus Limnocylindrales bacterium]